MTYTLVRAHVCEQTVPEGDQPADADVAAPDCQVVAPAAALAAADALHAGLHKYAAALTAALGEANAQGSSEALAAFLAAFPPPARAPSKSASSSPSVSPVINERAGPGGDSVQPSPIKKKGGLGFSAAGTIDPASRVIAALAYEWLIEMVCALTQASGRRPS
jgi:hypothetical protein